MSETKRTERLRRAARYGLSALAVVGLAAVGLAASGLALAAVADASPRGPSPPEDPARLQDPESPPPQAEEPVADAASFDQVIDMILAKVNGEAILLSDLRQREEEQLGVLRRQIPESELEAQLPQIRTALLGGMIQERVVLDRAEELGIEVSANDVDRSIARIRESQGLADEEMFEQQLAAEGMTIEEFRDTMRNRILTERVLYEEVRRQIFVSDSEIEGYYADNRDQFSAPERVRIRQLVFLVEGGDDEALRQTAEAAAAEVRSGAAITEVAARYEGARLAGGEDSSPLPTSDLMPEVAAAVEGLSPGQVSDAVETRYGFTVVQLVDREEHQVRPLAELRDQIRSTILQRKQEERMESYMQQLSEQVHVEIFAPQFQQLAEEWSGDRDDRPGATSPARQRR